jgi:hypothetical protein
MNLTTKPIELPPGAVVSTLQPVAQIDATSSVGNDEQTAAFEAVICGLDETVPSSIRSSLFELLKRYRGAFSFHENDLGRAKLLRHGIDTGDARSVRQALRRQPPEHQTAIKEHVSTMLAQGVIEPAQSPWASNVVIVKKKDGSTRPCIDIRQLNSVMRKDAYPLPRTDMCVDALTGARWFSTLDLHSSYHQVEVCRANQDSRIYTQHDFTGEAKNVTA